MPSGGSGINPPGTYQPNVYFSYIIGRYKIQSSTTTPKVCINNSFLLDTITITGFPDIVNDVDVKVNISTRDAQDVDLYLIKGVNSCELSTDNGGTGDSYINTIFDDDAQLLISQGSAPFTGKYKPEAALTIFDGQPVNGMWILQYTDDSNTGYNTTLDSWSLEIIYETVNGIIQNVTIPSKYMLLQNFPNPFNPSTVITFGLPQNGNTKLTVYDVTGKETAVLVNEFRNAGMYDISVDMNSLGLSSGVYFYKLESKDYVSVKKMILVK